MAVVFPAPFGPRNPQMLPAGSALSAVEPNIDRLRKLRENLLRLRLEATVTIVDDPAIVTATVIDADADESGPDSGTIRLARSGGNLAGMLNIQITMSGAASNGQDYGPFGGGFSIPVNQS